MQQRLRLIEHLSCRLDGVADRGEFAARDREHCRLCRRQRVMRHALAKQQVLAAAPTEARHVGPAWQADDQRIARASAGVIAHQRLAQPDRFDAHDRIGLWVEPGSTPQRPGSDGICLDPRRLAGKSGFHHEGEKARQPQRIAKCRTIEDAVELVADLCGCLSHLGGRGRCEQSGEGMPLIH